MKYLKLKGNSLPTLLQSISDPPSELYCAGKIPSPSQKSVAIVGSRTPTDYGRAITYRLAYELAQADICIVSGLAYGIDTIAHSAALDAGGQTIAVLGSGFDQIYPRNNRRLAENIIKQNGMILSEYSPDTAPLKHHFPKRNRLIAGLSDIVIVTEANAKSGSLITAALALDYGRVVMAVPGNINSPRSAGPNFLIKMGAGVVTDTIDILTELGIEQIHNPAQPTLKLSQLQSTIVTLINDGHTSTQAIMASLDSSPADIAVALSSLEIAGAIKQQSTGSWLAILPKTLAKSPTKL